MNGSNSEVEDGLIGPSENDISRSSDEFDSEELDPRVKDELDHLNGATDEINQLETRLEEANNSFRTYLSTSSAELQQLSRKLGPSVDRARPYYEAVATAKKLHADCQKAALQYHRANAVHQAARSTISIAEERFTANPEEVNSRHFDPAWQEMLNHATKKVIEAEAGRGLSERDHALRAEQYRAASARVATLGRQMRSAVNKARPYFERKSAMDEQLRRLSEMVCVLGESVSQAKKRYSRALSNLEQISEEIHEQRRMSCAKREPGVGEEAKGLVTGENDLETKTFEPIAESLNLPIIEPIKNVQICPPIEPIEKSLVEPDSSIRLEIEPCGNQNIMSKVKSDSILKEVVMDVKNLSSNYCEGTMNESRFVEGNE